MSSGLGITFPVPDAIKRANLSTCGTQSQCDLERRSPREQLYAKMQLKDKGPLGSPSHQVSGLLIRSFCPGPRPSPCKMNGDCRTFLEGLSPILLLSSRPPASQALTDRRRSEADSKSIWTRMSLRKSSLHAPWIEEFSDDRCRRALTGTFYVKSGLLKASGTL